MPVEAALDTAIAFLKRYGIHAVYGLAIAFLLFRLYGFLWWDGVIEQRDKARSQFAECVKAGEEAKAKQIALNKQTEATYKAEAEKADDRHAKELALANDRTERWIAANRVRQTGGSRPGGASAAAEGEAAERGDGRGEGTDLVAVSADDVRICTENTVRLKAVHEWGEGLKAAGVAE